MDGSLKRLREESAVYRGKGFGYRARYPSALRQAAVTYSRGRPESP